MICFSPQPWVLVTPPTFIVLIPIMMGSAMPTREPSQPSTARPTNWGPLTNIVNNPGHAVVGALIGQLVFPLPIVGAALGAVIGAHIGAKE